MHPASSTHGDLARRIGRAAGAAILGAALVAAIVVAQPASAAPPDAEGCGYGTGGPFADTLCWIDMSAYNDATARSVDGQDMSATLPGGYTVSFTVRTSGTRNIVASPFPTWEGAAVGNLIYTSTPDAPALYQVVGGGAASTTIALTDIEVTDAADTPVHGWRFVGVDAEGTADSESITFTSSSPVSVLASYSTSAASNGCQRNVNQVDDNTITCTGEPTGPDYGTVLVAATEPTSFTQTMDVSTGISREGVAFAFQSSTVSLATVVSSRSAAADSFDTAVVSPESTELGGASTGPSDAATTGDLVVLPRVDGSAYTLQETAGAGTDLADYDISWACTRDGVADPSLSATGVSSIEVSPEAGEAIACTVTNSVAGDPPPTTPTSPEELPRTGSGHAAPLSGMGLGLIAVGALAAASSRRRLAVSRARHLR